MTTREPVPARLPASVLLDPVEVLAARQRVLVRRRRRLLALDAVMQAIYASPSPADDGLLELRAYLQEHPEWASCDRREP